MSTKNRPGMAVNEEQIKRLVRETSQQAERAHYPARPTGLHEPAREWTERIPEDDEADPPAAVADESAPLKEESAPPKKE